MTAREGSSALRRRVLRILLAAVLMVAAVFAAVPSAANADSVRNWKVWVGSESPNMAFQGMRFLPGAMTIDAGDSVTWLANSTEIHTVSFPKDDAPLPPDRVFNLQTDIVPAGGSVYDGHSYYNSGVMTTMTSFDVFPPGIPLVHQYRLTFPRAGTFTYWCLVHGAMMKGVIHVHAAGAPYPHSQRWYNAKARAQARALVIDGQRLRAVALRSTTPHHVLAGVEDSKVSVMRFLRATVTVHVGESVTFDDTNKLTPHTVTFGQEPPVPALFNHVASANYGGGDLSSFLSPGQTFTVTFTAAGTYPYICALHDMMGMNGKVVVRP